MIQNIVPIKLPNKIFFFIAVLILLLYISGCEQSLSVRVESDIPIPLVTKYPVNVGIYYDDTFRNYAYRENTAERKNWTIESGTSQVTLFDQVLGSIFQSVQPVSTISASGMKSNIDAIVSPAIEEMQFALPKETRLDIYEAWIKYKIRLYDPDGDLIADWPFTAYGKVPTEFSKSRDKGLQAAIELAIRDAGAKIAIHFPKAEGIKQWLEHTIGGCVDYTSDSCQKTSGKQM